MVHTGVADISPGGSSEAAPPVPIPNTVVKRFSTDDTALATAWENRPLPGDFNFLRSLLIIIICPVLFHSFYLYIRTPNCDFLMFQQTFVLYLWHVYYL